MVKPVPGVMTMLSRLTTTELLITLKIIVKWFTTGQRFALRLFQKWTGLTYVLTHTI